MNSVGESVKLFNYHIFESIIIIKCIVFKLIKKTKMNKYIKILLCLVVTQAQEEDKSD